MKRKEERGEERLEGQTKSRKKAEGCRLDGGSLDRRKEMVEGSKQGWAGGRVVREESQRYPAVLFGQGPHEARGRRVPHLEGVLVNPRSFPELEGEVAVCSGKCDRLGLT